MLAYKIRPNFIKLYAEIFGKVKIIPQNENTPFYPRSPYGVAKLFVIGLRRTIEKLILCSLQTAYYLIVRGEAKCL